MDLWISLDKDFEKLFKELSHEHHDFMKLEGLTSDKLDPTRFFKGFIASGNVADASIDPNSNVGTQNMNTLLNEMSKPFQKLLSLNKLFIEMKEEFGLEVAEKAIKAHILGDIYIHDLASFSYIPYCYAYSLKPIVEKGLFFINEMKANPPKHLDTFNSHVMETIAFLTNLQSGAVGIPDYLLWSFYFWKKDKEENYIFDPEKYKYQQFQRMIFELNQPYLKINQSAYTNISILDRDYFIGLFGSLVFPDGTMAIDYIEEFMQYQKDFMKFESKLREQKGFTFPVLTFSSIFKDGQWQDEDMAKFIIKHNMKWGDTNIYVSENADALSSCCRMTFDTKEINKGKAKLEGNFNSIGGSDLSIGSTKVIDINYARVGYIARGDFEKAKQIVKELTELIQKIHFVHRERILKKNIERGLLPQYTHGLMNMDRQYATVGVASLEEFVWFMGGIDKDVNGELSYNDYGLKIASEITQYVNDLGKDTIDKYNFTQSQEVSPNESGAVTLLKKDRLFFNDNIVDKVAYANQFTGLDQNFPLEERVRVDGYLASKMSGGNILHLNIGEDWSSFEAAFEFNTKIAKNGSKYWSEIRKYQYCKNDHNFFGDKCPICGEKPKGDIIKIVGYLVKNEYYQKERREELEHRKFYLRKQARRLPPL